ncbi:hypothetical protein R6Q57_019456 [Mikania cordata]
MFNFILRESPYEIPTDHVANPITKSRVLLIPVGDLSFGLGSQLNKTCRRHSLSRRYVVATAFDAIAS